MADPKTTYLSLGSNLGNKANNLQQALFAIQQKVGNIVRISPVYKSGAWGFDADDFLNVCIALETELAPHDLLQGLLEIERHMGRTRLKEEGYEPRLIDIDILYYEKESVVSDTLIVPHPEIPFRKFVLKPLSDIAPQFYHPILNKDTRNLLQECRDKGTLEKTTVRLFKDRQSLLAHLGFISIEGNIGAGKTTLANKIAEDYNAKLVLERFADNPFLPKFYEDQSRYAFPLEMSFLADRYQQFTDDTSQYDLFKNFMVSDYDIYKSLIFAQVTLQKEEFRLYRKLFNLMYREVKKPKIYVYLYQTTERLLDNIKKRGREYEQNITADYLEKINQGYFDFIRSYPGQNSLVLDVTELDFVASTKDYESVVKNIQDFATEKVL
ncbi:2-amino-4-hydroxy-6-hydroxymethyldihydropteridine diphosphokinase [Flavobacteriaceae bacterium TP-CH-4]|uniref:2-amino-4-hydroxy-6-hydroxymethyldihydropteridine pyrophosphokinase n=1 Tax=Pelagihabitans pacificus TaxID=2696054 RepID=A0A967AQ62_9FLAO|nr:2-amino-4-hydroxy-6-hydroxymethyldihydropteridine diphosphokinase [Pelagihabitans pacificus]NHF58313.1 2-amino-4-hydroxy-6-hydroxymethyldihydropteridine diphosphokinase [Pelagihabitans pacificus]